MSITAVKTNLKTYQFPSQTDFIKRTREMKNFLELDNDNYELCLLVFEAMTSRVHSLANIKVKLPELRNIQEAFKLINEEIVVSEPWIGTLISKFEERLACPVLTKDMQTLIDDFISWSSDQ